MKSGLSNCSHTRTFLFYSPPGRTLMDCQNFICRDTQNHLRVIFKISFDLPYGHTSLINFLNVIHIGRFYAFEFYQFAEIAFFKLNQWILLPFKTDLLGFDLYTIKFSQRKCTIQWFKYIYIVVQSSRYNLRIFL